MIGHFLDVCYEAVDVSRGAEDGAVLCEEFGGPGYAEVRRAVGAY